MTPAVEALDPMTCEPFVDIVDWLHGRGLRFEDGTEGFHVVFGWRDDAPIRLELDPLHDGPWCHRGARFAVVTDQGRHECGPVATVDEFKARLWVLAEAVEGA